MIKCNDNRIIPERNADNIYVRFYKTSCFMGQSRKFGIGVMRPLGYWEKKPHRDELYIIQKKDDDGLWMLGGAGTMRMDLKDMFKKNLGTENPTFAQVREYFESRSDLNIQTLHNENLKG